MLTFMWSCRSSWCYAHAGWGGGDGVGCERSCEVADDDHDDDDDDDVHPDDDDDDDDDDDP